MHALEVPAHVLRANAGRDAVTEVRDPALGSLALPTLLEAGAHALDLGLDAVLAAVKADGVSVALEGDSTARCLERLLRRDAPVDGEHVKVVGRREQGKGRRGALGEEDDGGRRQAERGELLSVDFGDLEQRRIGERLEVVRGEFTGPRVEDLNDLSGERARERKMSVKEQARVEEGRSRKASVPGPQP